MTCIGMACIVMACIVMACIVMASKAIADFVHGKGMKFGFYTSGTEGLCDGQTHNASDGN